MSFFFFYNNRKPRSFEHKPIYYNPQKEALQNRIAEIQEKAGTFSKRDKEYKTSIKGSFIRGTTQLRKKRSQTTKSRNNRWLILFTFITILLLYLLFSRIL